MQSSRMDFIQSPFLNIKHGWFKRYGGVSGGDFASLNVKMGLGDSDFNIEENIRRAAKLIELNPEKAVFIRHNFRDNILVVNKNTAPGYYQDYDSVITNRKDIWLAQGTADCGTVIVSDLNHSFIALVHGSWHTTRLNILAKTIKKVVSLYGIPIQNMTASFGPMLCGSCFEFGPEASQFFEPKYLTIKNNQYLFNNKCKMLDQLIDLGFRASNIWDADMCTMESSDLFSYRRSAKHGKSTGRFLTAVGLQ